MIVDSAITESSILERVVAAKEGSLSPEAAKSFLEFHFPPDQTKRIRRLLRKNNSGKITAQERVTLERYLRIGQFLDLLHAKARASLIKKSRTK